MTEQNTTTIAAAIRDAYDDLSVKEQDWVRLARLRSHEALAGIDRADVDDTIKKLIRSEDVVAAPDSNRKVLTAEDHAAALVWGETYHLIAFPVW